MNVRRMILLAAAATLASRAGAEGTTGDAQQPPGRSQSWYQKDAQKARELGQQGEGEMRRGAAGARDKLNEGGQAASAKVVGTKTVRGEVADVSRDQVTVKRSDGAPLGLRITASTKVTVDGQKGSIGSLQQGDEVRASYAQSGGSATATKIDVRRSASGASSTSK